MNDKLQESVDRIYRQGAYQLSIIIDHIQELINVIDEVPDVNDAIYNTAVDILNDLEN